MGVSPFLGALLPEVGSFEKCIEKTFILRFSQNKFNELQRANHTGLNFSSSELTATTWKCIFKKSNKHSRN